MVKTMNVPQKLVAVIACFAMAFALIGIAPMKALATYDSGSITASQSSVSVAAGSTLSMADYFTETATGGDGEWHVDYKVTSGSDYATVNKHSGILTGVAEGTAVVTAYLTPIAQPTSNKNNPCTTTDVSATITVNVTAALTYGYQGTGFQIKMDTPAVGSTTSATSGGVTTYTNTLSDTQTANSTVTFTYYQNAGLNQYLNFYSTWEYDSPEDAYKALAGQYITYTDASGTTTTLANATNMSVTSVTSSTVTIAVNVGSAGTGTLHFLSGLHTFKQSNTAVVNKSLGANLDFTFGIA